MSVTKPAAATPDADKNNWVDNYAPSMARPYLRLMRADRPIGVWLLAMPCWFGLALAVAENGAGPVGFETYFSYALLFLFGAFVMRGAGCAYNDIVDRDIDAAVARTALRPIPSGQISVKRAWVFLVFLSFSGLVVLVQFNRFTVLLGVASLALVAAYPFMKRITWWPQIWLGLTFNWGALMGYAAHEARLSLSAIALYGACILWTLGYDTIYAHQDREDDALIGVKSSARALGEKTHTALALFYGGVIALMALIGVLSHFSLVYHIALIGPAAHFLWQVKTLNIDDPAHCLKLFKANRSAGLLLLTPLLLEAAR